MVIDQVAYANITFLNHESYKVLMEPVVLNRERDAADRIKRMPMLFDDYRDEDFYGLPRKYSIVARVEVKFPIEPRYRDRQHFILSDINSSSSLRIIPQYTSIRSITTPTILDQFKKLWWRGTTVSLLLHFLKSKGVDRFYNFTKSNNWNYV
ncbi:hypothetical protein Zm00014a_044026 [Zea mays]|uniref:Uncharacterized protein n=1 Tax=Zea mays TaxID=4577 RepID=A0A317Y6A6_MAIZE|nr:hypothetical protein Zm00014a_044026 [Zea mays]